MTIPDVEALVRMIQLQARTRGVDPDLAVAVARQESSLNLHAVGDGGKSLGVFQLSAAAAQDAGIDPADRLDVVANITGGVEYLRQSLARANGQVPLALDYYNKGPSLRGGDRQYVDHVMQYYPGDGERAQARQRIAALQARLAADEA